MGQRERVDRRMSIRLMRKNWSVALHVFFFNDTATTEIYTLSLHDALPISKTHTRLPRYARDKVGVVELCHGCHTYPDSVATDRKSTRLNSSHLVISYAVFCLKKKTQPFNSFSPSSTSHATSPLR